MDQNVRNFIKSSGFKILALARLSDCEYSLALYLLNCSVSGLDQIVTTESELASLMGYTEAEIGQTLDDLASKYIIRIHYGDKSTSDNHSLRLGLQYDMTKWVLQYDEDATSNDAIVFPFRRQGQAALQLLEGQKKRHKPSDSSAEEQTWRRVLESYVQGRSLDDEEVNGAEESAKILIETHPVDQVLLMLRHFGLRIPTLSLLASSWQHYQEIFEDETHNIDLLEARQKHIELDDKVRENAQNMLEKAEEFELTEEELTVLQILVKHRHPRRQLFWAYQARSRYPQLDSFFGDNVALMLPVTSGGTVVKRTDS